MFLSAVALTTRRRWSTSRPSCSRLDVDIDHAFERLAHDGLPTRRKPQRTGAARADHHPLRVRTGLRGDRVAGPAPHRAGHEMRPADPAVDAAQLHGVELTRENP